MTSIPTRPHAIEYSIGAKVLHWLTAAAVLTAISLGIAMLNLEGGPLQDQLFDLHRSFGALILALTAIRLIWRYFNAPPPLVPGLPVWQAKAARISHILLYVFLFAVPLVGWAATSAFGAPISIFGMFELPPMLDKNKALSDIILPLHAGMALTLAALLSVHIGAALHHHYIRKDETLRRML